MDQYLFILGRNPVLSVAEIATLARARQRPLTWQAITESYAVVKGDITSDFFNQLAGSIKLAQVLGEFEYKPDPVRDFITNYLNSVASECLFGFSWYGRRPPRWLRGIGMELKRQLKESDGHVRLVESRQAILSSVVVKKNHLLPPRGTEFIFQPFSETRIIIARTVAVQEFADWSERDYGRPQRDAKVGMLPPKLARLMINLAGGLKTEALLDPFCGSGTVLQEAALLGYKNIVGSDADSRGIERAKANFTWLKQRYQNIKVEPKLLVADVRDLSRQLKEQQFDAIVTEPYLGPPLKGNEPEGRLRQIASELTDLYRTTLKVFTHLLVPQGRIVMVWPVFHIGSRTIHLPLLKDLPGLGWQIEKLIPPQAPTGWLNQRGTLLYERPGQRVGREIVVLHRV